MSEGEVVEGELLEFEPVVNLIVKGSTVGDRKYVAWEVKTEHGSVLEALDEVDKVQARYAKEFAGSELLEKVLSRVPADDLVEAMTDELARSVPFPIQKDFRGFDTTGLTVGQVEEQNRGLAKWLSGIKYDPAEDPIGILLGKAAAMRLTSAVLPEVKKAGKDVSEIIGEVEELGRKADLVGRAVFPDGEEGAF